MLNSISLSSIVFIDIETASLYPKYEDLNKTEQHLWDGKCKRLQQDGETPDELYGKAGIFSEFSKVICISVGYIYNNSETDSCAIKIKSVFAYDDNNNIVATHGALLDGTAWVNEHRDTYTYDENNNRIESSTQDWDGTEWVNDSIYTYTFDENNN